MVMCGYCDQVATHHTTECMTPDPICKPCARSQTDGPVGEYVRPLTPTKLKRYADTGRFER